MQSKGKILPTLFATACRGELPTAERGFRRLIEYSCRVRADYPNLMDASVSGDTVLQLHRAFDSGDHRLRRVHRRDHMQRRGT